MQQRFNILVVVKHAPLFNIIKHLLTDMPEAGEIGHIKSWPRLKIALTGHRFDTPFDIVMIELAESQQAQAVELLHACWPAARIVLLAFDSEFVQHRAATFDAVLSKYSLSRNLVPWLRRIMRALNRTSLRSLTLPDNAGSEAAATALRHNELNNELNNEHKQVALSEYLQPISDPLPNLQESAKTQSALRPSLEQRFLNSLRRRSTDEKI